MHSLQTIFKDTLVGGLKRKAVTTSSKWAEKYRVLGSPIPGQWAFTYHPWLREMHDSESRFCIGQKSSQMGYTETVLNITLFNIDISARDCLYILPSKTPDASDFSASRFDSALELSSHLANMFSDVKNVGHKRAGSASLYVRGSNSRGGLKSIPVSFIVFDELDEFNQDNISLAEERVSGQTGWWQIWKISTPTAPEMGINAEFRLSTQEHFFFKCPRCNRTTELIFPECLVVTADDPLDLKINNSHIICKECKGKLEHKEKRYFLKDGVWVPGAPTAKNRGFYINHLYSSAIAGDPVTLATATLKAQTSLTVQQELYNSKIGVPFVPKGAQVTSIELLKALGNYKKDDETPKGQLITMGVDQGTWLHYEVSAWSFKKLGNDLNMMAKSRVLTQGKCLDFAELEQLMRRWQITMCVIDGQPEKRLAYEFACKFWGHVKICFFNTSKAAKVIDVKDDNSHRISVDRTFWLDAALNRFHNNTIELPSDTDIEYKAHLTRLVRRYERDADGNPVGRYISTSTEDHYAFARCYDEMALPCAAALTTNSNIGRFL